MEEDPPRTSTPPCSVFPLSRLPLARSFRGCGISMSCFGVPPLPLTAGSPLVDVLLPLPSLPTSRPFPSLHSRLPPSFARFFYRSFLAMAWIAAFSNVSVPPSTPPRTELTTIARPTTLVGTVMAVGATAATGARKKRPA